MPALKACFTSFTSETVSMASCRAEPPPRPVTTTLWLSGRDVMASMMPEGSDLDAFIGQQVSQMTSPWSRFFYNYNPADELAKIKDCPVLSLNGTKDLQVLADVNQSGIEKALEKAGNKDVTIVKIENLNHLFQECETGAMSEYGQIEQTFSPKALTVGHP